MKMSEASRTDSGPENLLALLSNPPSDILAKVKIGRSCIIRAGRIDEPRGFYEVTKGDEGLRIWAVIMGGRPRKEEARPEDG